MSDGISPNNLNDLSKVYLDQISTFREMRKQETQKDIERWSQGADPTATQREGYEEKKRGEVLSALKKRPLDKKTKEKIAADIVKKKGDTSKSDDRYAYEEVQVEAKVDTGSAEAKASARNKRNTPAGKDYDFDTSVFITRKPGESLDSARTRKRRDAHAAKRGVKESFSNWRDDLIEVLDKPETEAASQKEVTEKKVKNKIEINPKISEAIEEIGGQVLSIEEQDTYQEEIEDAVEYFYEQGINERGVELIIEEVGLDDFVEFVIDPSEDLMEERKARRASVRAKKFPEVKADVDKADAARKASKKGEYAASYAKKETDVTDYGDKAPAKKKPAAMKKAVARKKAVLKQPIAKKATPLKKAQTQKKVVKSVAKVKKVQPAKSVSKKGIRGVIQRGVERHQKAVGKAKSEVQRVAKIGRDTAKQHREHGKKFISGLRATPKEKKIAGGIAKAAKKALTREELVRLEALAEKKKKPSVHDDYYDPMEDPTFDPHEAEATRGQSGRGTAGKMNVRKKYPVKEGNVAEADSLAGQIARWEAGRHKRMKRSGTYERPNWIPRDQDHEDRYGSSKGKKSTAEGYQRNPEKGEAEERKAEKKRKASGAMPPRGDKRREDFERWYAANVR